VFFYVPPSQRRVKTVCHNTNFPASKPGGCFFEHFDSQFDKRFFVLAMHPHIDRQAQRLAAPWRLNLQCQHDKIQTPCVNDFGFGQTNRISPKTCAVDFSAAAMKQRVVDRQRNNARNCSTGSTQNPAGDQTGKYFCAWNCETGKKLLNKQRPCRYALHSNTNLSMCLWQTSHTLAGWFFYVQSSSNFIQKSAKAY